MPTIGNPLINGQLSGIFNGAALQQQISTMLADNRVPLTHKFALVGTIDNHGMQVLASFRSVDEHWRFVGSFHQDWTTGDSTEAAQIIYSR